MPKFSVVIATYNRAELLKNCLESLASQSVQKTDYEILLINDGSRDHTDQIIEDFRKKYPAVDLKYFRQINSGVASARNVGIKNAAGDIVFFTDDDCTVPENWIETLAGCYSRNPDIAGAGGWVRYPNDKNLGYLTRTYIDYTGATHYLPQIAEPGALQEIKNNIFAKNPAGNTSNMSYLRTTLQAAGGFDTNVNFVGLVDVELKKRITDSGRPLLFVPYHVHHFKPIDSFELMRKFFNRGRGRYHIVKKNPDLKQLLSPSITTALRRMAARGENRYNLKCMAALDYFFMMIGWAYQNFYER